MTTIERTPAAAHGPAGVARRPTRGIANAVAAVTLVLFAVSVVFSATDRSLSPEDEGDAFYIGATVLGSLLYLFVGRLIVVRQPAPTIGWLLLARPLIGSILLANAGYAKRAVVLEPGSLPFGVASAVASSPGGGTTVVGTVPVAAEMEEP